LDALLWLSDWYLPVELDFSKITAFPADFIVIVFLVEHVFHGKRNLNVLQVARFERNAGGELGVPQPGFGVGLVDIGNVLIVFGFMGLSGFPKDFNESKVQDKQNIL
jgi:hypothetical protein